MILTCWSVPVVFNREFKFVVIIIFAVSYERRATGQDLHGGERMWSNQLPPLTMPGTIAWRNYGAKVQLDGKAVYFKLAVREDNIGSLHYNHDATDAELMEKGPTDSLVPSKTGSGKPNPFRMTLAEWACSVNADSEPENRFSLNPEHVARGASNSTRESTREILVFLSGTSCSCS